MFFVRTEIGRINQYRTNDRPGQTNNKTTKTTKIGEGPQT